MLHPDKAVKAQALTPKSSPLDAYGLSPYTRSLSRSSSPCVFTGQQGSMSVSSTSRVTTEQLSNTGFSHILFVTVVRYLGQTQDCSSWVHLSDKTTEAL